MAHRGDEPRIDATPRDLGNRGEQRGRRCRGTCRERVDVSRLQHQSPGRPWMSGKNRSCHFVGGSFSAADLAHEHRGLEHLLGQQREGVVLVVDHR